MPFDLDAYVKKLMNAKRRIMLVNNILQNAQVNMIYFCAGLCSFEKHWTSGVFLCAEMILLEIA